MHFFKNIFINFKFKRFKRLIIIYYFGAGEFMNIDEEEELDDDFFQRLKKKQEKSKQEILDETFKKAELSRDIKGETNIEKRKSIKKPLKLSSFLLIFLAIFAVICVNFVPWMYINANTTYGPSEVIIENNFNIINVHHNSSVLLPIELFSFPCENCSYNSSSYIGLTSEDFTKTYNLLLLILYIFIGLSVIFSTFIIIDRFKNYSFEFVNFFHSFYAVGIIICSIIIFLSITKFISAYFLLYYNWSYIKELGFIDVRIVSIVPLILLLLSVVFIKIGTTLIKGNFKEIIEQIHTKESESEYSTYRYGVIKDEE